MGRARDGCCWLHAVHILFVFCKRFGCSLLDNKCFWLDYLLDPPEREAVACLPFWLMIQSQCRMLRWMLWGSWTTGAGNGWMQSWSAVWRNPSSRTLPSSGTIKKQATSKKMQRSDMLNIASSIPQEKPNKCRTLGHANSNTQSTPIFWRNKYEMTRSIISTFVARWFHLPWCLRTSRWLFT